MALQPETRNKGIRFGVYMLLTMTVLAVICLAIYYTYVTITDYKPAIIESLTMKDVKQTDTLPAGRFELYTWNIGYCSRGKDIANPAKENKLIQPDKEYYEKCRDGILYQLTTLNKLDFILLQEVDEQSDRTFKDNQVERFKATFNEYFAFFSINYKIPFSLFPFGSPKGKVKSGILTLSRFRPVEATRYSFPSAFGWPKKLLKPDRCFSLTRYAVNNGKQLVIINTHNSTTADDSGIGDKELDMLKKIIVEEYSKGNYVIAGGDWNRNPLSFNSETIKDGNSVKTIASGMPADFLPAGYTWAYDAKYPTKRELDIPFAKGRTATTITDFFILSPNISLLTANTLQTEFTFSDHQPAGIIVELK